MSEFEPVASSLWWLPFITLLIAAGCITAGLDHLYRALWLWRHRNTPISDPLIARLVADVKPPPYAAYAAILLVVGIGAAGITFRLWQ